MDLRHGSRACPVATAVETFTQGTGAAYAGDTSNLSGTMTFAAGQTIAALGLGGVTVVHLDVGGGLSVHRREDRPAPSGGADDVSSSLAGGTVAVNAITDESYSIPAAHTLKTALK